MNQNHPRLKNFKQINSQIKYQTPNVDSLIETFSQTLSIEPQETAYFTTMELQYKYSQLNLHADTTRCCNFNLVSGDLTGTYFFKTDFYD